MLFLLDAFAQLIGGGCLGAVVSTNSYKIIERDDQKPVQKKVLLSGRVALAAGLVVEKNAGASGW